MILEIKFLLTLFFYDTKFINMAQLFIEIKVENHYVQFEKSEYLIIHMGWWEFLEKEMQKHDDRKGAT